MDTKSQMEELLALVKDKETLNARLKELLGVKEAIAKEASKDRMKELEIQMRYFTLYERSKRQPLDIRLKRFLLYGDETPLYQPGDRTQPKRMNKSRSTIVEDYLDKIEQEREKIADNEKLQLPSVESLEMFKAIDEALEDESRPFRECVIYVLAQCARYKARVPPVDHLKSLAYTLAKKHMKSEADFFLFIKLALKTDVEKPLFGAAVAAEKGRENCKVGWGKGMRKFVANWYNSQDPVQLAKRISHQNGSYGWAHGDLIKQSHIKLKVKDGPLAAVFHYALFGFDKTLKEFETHASCKPVLDEFKKRKAELDADPNSIVSLVTSNKLKVDEVASEKFSLALWKALVENMTAREVLKVLPRLWCLNMVNDDSVWKAAAVVLEATDAGKQVYPAEAYVSLNDYLKAIVNHNKRFDAVYVAKRKPVLPREPNLVIVSALKKLVEASFKAVQPNGVRVLMTVDLRSHTNPNFSLFPIKCAYSHSVTPMQATALIALCLSRHHKRFTLTALAEDADGGMQIISVPKTATVDTLMEKFQEVKVCKYPKICAPIVWAKERKRDLDAFVMVTPCLKSWDWKSNDYTVLDQYKEEMKKPDARFAVCALGNMYMEVAQQQRSVSMMDFAGFDAKTIPLLNTFINGELCSASSCAE